MCVCVCACVCMHKDLYVCAFGVGVGMHISREQKTLLFLRHCPTFFSPTALELTMCRLGWLVSDPGVCLSPPPSIGITSMCHALPFHCSVSHAKDISEPPGSSTNLVVIITRFLRNAVRSFLTTMPSSFLQT